MTNARFTVRGFLVAALSLAIASAALATPPDVDELVKHADQARGGGIPGLLWDVLAVNTGADDELPDHRLRIKAVNTSSLAEILEPANSRGARMLQVDRNMWLTKPGLRKPVAISPRQRLTGQAAVGDIAATNYAKDYSAAFIQEEPCGTEHCYMLELKANSKQTTYDRIAYWISAARGVAVKADFMTPSGKLLKSAQFEYENAVSVGEKRIPFISQMTIRDALSDARTTLQYSNIRVQKIPHAEFDVANLQ